MKINLLMKLVEIISSPENSVISNIVNRHRY